MALACIRAADLVNCLSTYPLTWKSRS